jgi:hypothetical protein
MTNHGGKRDGAGRKPGVPNAMTAERIAEIEASGLTPLDFMLDVLRDEEAAPAHRMWAAEKAAPYVHPRLAAIQHSGPNGESLPNLHAFTDEQLERIVAGGAP